MQTKRFENAFQFLGSYFHQDFSVEFGEPEIAVRGFIKGTDLVAREAAVRELRLLLAESRDEDLEDAVFQLGCYYSPRRHRGIPMRVWLSQVVDVIDQSTSAENRRQQS